MKNFLSILSLVLFVTVTSCTDSSVEDLDETQNIEKINKQKKILQKLEELGIDPSNVNFTDHVEGQKIVVEKIEDLDKIFPKEVNVENNFNESYLDETILAGNSSSSKSLSVLDYRQFTSSIAVPGSRMSIYYQFWWNPYATDYDFQNAIQDVSAYVIGGDGVTYSVDSYEYAKRGSAPTTTIRGRLLYPIIVDGEYAYVSRSASIICQFQATSTFTYVPHSHVLFFSHQ